MCKGFRRIGDANLKWVIDKQKQRSMRNGELPEAKAKETTTGGRCFGTLWKASLPFLGHCFGWVGLGWKESDFINLASKERLGQAGNRIAAMRGTAAVETAEGRVGI